MRLHWRQITFPLFLIYWCYLTEAVLDSNKLVIGFALSLTIPAAAGFPLDFLWKRFRSEDPAATLPPPTPHPPLYYQFATNLLGWAFEELSESQEEKTNPISGRWDVDKMASSEEYDDDQEEDAGPPKLDTMAEKIDFLRKGRAGSSGSRLNSEDAFERTKIKPAKKEKEFNEYYDENIEKASLPELKLMLNDLKHEDDGIFSSPMFVNPIATTVISFGTGIFKKMYCGWSSQNAYCSPEQYSNSLFDIFKKRSFGNSKTISRKF